MDTGLNNPVGFDGSVRLDRLESRDRFLPGTFTVDTLPAASAYSFMYAPVTDLGGGADFVVSDGQYWKHIRRGVFENAAANSNISISPLKSSLIFLINGTINTNMVISVLDQARLYPGYQLTIKRAAALSTVVGLVGSLGVRLGNTGTAQLALTETTSNLIWDGGQFVQI